jgi:hypothetical protein
MAPRFGRAPLFRAQEVKILFGLALILVAILMLAVLGSVSPPLVANPLAVATV